MFFTSLITPAILLVLYATFLGSVYRDSFTANLPDGFSLSQKLIDGAVGAQLISSIFAVSCVTVPFCSNMLMVQDKITGARKDLTISPVSSAVLSGSYFLGAAISSLLVCFAALALCLGYVRTIGWFFSGKDILLLSADIVLLVLFGTALSSLIHFFLSTQGQRYPQWEHWSAPATAFSAVHICPFPVMVADCKRCCPFCPARI